MLAEVHMPASSVLRRCHGSDNPQTNLRLSEGSLGRGKLSQDWRYKPWAWQAGADMSPDQWTEKYTKLFLKPFLLREKKKKQQEKRKEKKALPIMFRFAFTAVVDL